MDSGLALVVGALIALVGSVAAPWVKDVVETRSRSRAELKRQKADLITEIVQDLANLTQEPTSIVEFRETRARLLTARTQLSILSPSKDDEIDGMLGMATQLSIATDDPNSVAPYAADLARTLLLDWYWGRRETKGIMQAFTDDVGCLTDAIKDGRVWVGGMPVRPKGDAESNRPKRE